MEKNTKILITGATGFLGSSLVGLLRSQGYSELLAIGSKDVDLRDSLKVDAYVDRERPKIVFHLAARVGGIGANQKSPATFWLDNTVMGTNLLSTCVKYGVERMVFVGTTCAYPKFCEVPFKESDLWMGYPEETNAPYGVAKKSLMVGAKAFRDEFGLDVRCPILTNLYGPGDHYDLENSHVIPAMIRKFHEAKVGGLPLVEFWGDGSPTRDFLFVDDASEALLVCAQSQTLTCDPVNFGSGCEISMKELAEDIQQVVDYRGEIYWNTARPNGQPRRLLDTIRAKNLGWYPKISMSYGLARTYTDYLDNVYFKGLS